MNDKLRYLLAGVLIFLIILLQPAYLKWLGYDSGVANNSTASAPQKFNETQRATIESLDRNNANPSIPKNNEKEVLTTILTPLYVATISNKGGGSINEYLLINEKNGGLQHIGGFNDEGLFVKGAPVSLIMPGSNGCQPCLASYIEGEYELLNAPFSLISSSAEDSIYLSANESLSLQYVLYDNSGNELIKKIITFDANNYSTQHEFYINSQKLNQKTNLELVWLNGLRPTEEKISEDIQYSSGIISQAEEMEDIQTNDPNKAIKRTVYNGNTDWVAIRSKYFISSLISNNANSLFATLSAENVPFGQRKHTPLYSASIGFPFDQKEILATLYLGPLDIDYITKTNSSLDSAMNWGWSIIKPISKGILWFLKFLHNTFQLNYGLVLLLFALLVRLVTGPLTKKSYESTQKMQKIQPQIKKVQEKFKKDPQRLNKEMMLMYKTHGVNPLGGCLPMLLQMPLLMALFIVFRTTIEFRGQPFILWISDLSKPDIVFSLPFNIPIYGDGVAILPLLMGLTLFLTMKMSSATMDSNQKPVMYIMNGFFILLFNSFPSGLNLYYTTYNLLSFFQQKGIRKKLSES